MKRDKRNPQKIAFRHWIIDHPSKPGFKVGPPHEPARQLAWLLNFVQDKGAIGKRNELEAKFAELAYFAALPSANPALRNRPRLDAVALQHFMTNVRVGIAALLEGGTWQLRDSIERTMRRNSSDEGGFIVSSYSADDLLVIARWRAQDLAGAHIQDIRRCRRSACGRLFVVNKRAEYCGRSCSQVERTARWRKKNPNDARELRHRSYKNKVAREKGAAAAKHVIRRTREVIS
jgi:hypothetical protein